MVKNRIPVCHVAVYLRNAAFYAGASARGAPENFALVNNRFRLRTEIMQALQKELTVRVIKGRQQVAREASETIWARFDRLQRSLEPLRKGRRLSRGIHYGRRT